jgi:Flp pilus assembly CpaE family ATPase
VSVVALCSARGAPGVTTSALALAWVWPAARPGRRVLLIDADPAGSGLLTGILASGVPPAAGLSSLAALRPPLSPDQVVACSLAVDGDATRMVLPGVSDPVQAGPLGGSWASLLDVARDLSDRGVDVLVDVGRVGHRFEPSVWLRESDALAVVVRGEVASVAPAAAAVRALAPTRGTRPTVGLVVDGAGYPAGEIAAAMSVGDVLVLPRDEWAARGLTAGATGGWRFDRSPLLRGAYAVVSRLAELAPELAVSSS